MTDRELMQQWLDAIAAIPEDVEGYLPDALTDVVIATRERLAQPEGAIIPHLPGICCKTGTCDREQPKMVLLDPEIGKIVFANLDKLYVEDPPAQQPEQQHEAYWLIAPNGTHYKNPKHPMNQEQPEQEPVAYIQGTGLYWPNDAAVQEPDCQPLYTTPPRREWVGLTQQDIDIAFDDTQEGGGFDDFARAIEAKLRGKNA